MDAFDRNQPVFQLVDLQPKIPYFPAAFSAEASPEAALSFLGASWSFGVRRFIAAFGRFAALESGQRPQSGDESPHSKTAAFNAVCTYDRKQVRKQVGKLSLFCATAGWIREPNCAV